MMTVFSEKMKNDCGPTIGFFFGHLAGWGKTKVSGLLTWLPLSRVMSEFDGPSSDITPAGVEMILPRSRSQSGGQKKTWKTRASRWSNRFGTASSDRLPTDFANSSGTWCSCAVRWHVGVRQSLAVLSRHIARHLPAFCRPSRTSFREKIRTP